MTDIDTAATRAEWARARAAVRTDEEATILGEAAWAETNALALLDEVDRLRAERDEARTTVARVEALRDHINGRPYPPRALARDLATALTPDTKETDRG